MRRATPIAAVLCIATATAAFAVPPATRPADPLAPLRAAERADLLRRCAALRVLTTRPSTDAFTLDVADGHLRLRTRTPATTGPVRLHLNDLPGDCTVTVAGKAAGAEPWVPTALLFEQWQFDRPGTVVTDTTVERLPTRLIVSRGAESPAGDRQVSYVERLAGDDDGPVAVLRAGSDSADAVVVTADSFTALRRLHPAEVATYLEPILRDLHVDAPLLPPDTVLAYQVFAADATVDPAVAAKVYALVARLNADDFHDRDAAVDQLKALAPSAGVALSRTDLTTLSPEQRGRVDAAMAAFRPVSAADAKRLEADRDFLLNCLLDADPFVVDTALSRLRASVGHDAVFDRHLTGDARRNAVWELRRQVAALPATLP